MPALSSWRRTAALVGMTLCLGGGAPLAHAHELPADRLTLVQRDAQHVSLQFHLDLLALMHRTLAPDRPQAEFLLALASQSTAQLASLTTAVQQRLSEGMLLNQGGRPGRLQAWHAPAPEQLQAAVRQRAMRLLTVAASAPAHEHQHPDDDDDDDELPFTAEVVWSGPVTPGSVITLQLPPALRPLLVVSYRPRQRWVEGGAPVELSF